ncbi:MAG: SPASM domain-containing protein, partial [Deltaproteobacteria bacterium]|nr:SPASM domain-containing protein [Deltaproteobacteria bacterium]
NLRCHTCGQWGDSGFLHGKNLKQLKEKEVSPARYLELFRDLVAHGHHPLIYFWGGEPMLYQGLLDLIDGAAALGLPPSIATNGTHIAAAAERLVKAPLFFLQVSVDGHCAELHNQVRPSAGGGNNFSDIQNGLQAVREARKAKGQSLPVMAALTVISQANLPHLLDIYEVFRDKVDLFVFYLSWWIDEARAEAHEQDFFHRFGFMPIRHRGWIGNWKPADPDLLYQQLKRLQTISRRWGAPAVSIIPQIADLESLKTYYTDHRQTFGFNQCVSIYQAVEVNSNGNLSPCRDYHDYVVGNVQEATISEIWNSEPYRRFRTSLSREGLMPVCSRCCGLRGY